MSARNRQSTEHVGAKKGAGGYWGYKADAKHTSNRLRRERDKLACERPETAPDGLRTQHHDVPLECPIAQGHPPVADGVPMQVGVPDGYGLDQCMSCPDWSWMWLDWEPITDEERRAGRVYYIDGMPVIGPLAEEFRAAEASGEFETEDFRAAEANAVAIMPDGSRNPSREYDSKHDEGAVGAPFETHVASCRCGAVTYECECDF